MGGRMKKKSLSFSERILAQRKARRNARAMLIFRLTFLSIAFLNLIFLIYMEHERRQPHWPTAEMSSSAPQMILVSKNEDGIPVLLNINGETWAVVRVKSFNAGDESSAAEMSCVAKTIVYLPDETPSRLRNSIIHEVFHAGACLHGGDSWWNSVNPDKNKHDGIYHLADFWTGFARANPEFMEWISR